MPRPRKVTGPEVVDPLLPPVDPEPVIESAVQPAIDVEPLEVAARPAKDAELTPEQLRIRELEHQLALERGRKDLGAPEPDPQEAVGLGEDGNVVVHVLEDGFTAMGQVWYRGQEMEFVPGSQQWRDTRDRNGNSWLDLRHDEFAQAERWGKVMFRPGPWPGRTYLDAAKVPFDGVAEPPTEEQFRAAQQAEARRRRAVPALR